MTINTTTTRVDYLGNGVTTAFPVPFVFFGLDELQVIERVIATGAETILARGTHYSVTGGQGSTGTVTATTAPVAGRQWTIRRATQLLQQTDFSRNDPFPSDSVERALDRAIAVVQEIDRDQGAVLRVSPTDTAPGPLPSAAVRANKLFGFDASGDPIAAEGVLGSLPVTPFIAGLLDDPTQDDALATLGATTVGRNVLRAATPALARAALGARASWDLVAEAVASNSASLDITTGLDDTFDVYRLQIQDLVAQNDDVALWLRVGTGGGPTWQAGAGSAYNSNILVTGNATSLGPVGVGSAMNLSWIAGNNAGVGNAAGCTISGHVEFDNPEANKPHTFRLHTSYMRSVSASWAAYGGGAFIAEFAAITGLRLLFSSGNIVSGRVRLLGMRKEA